MGTQGRECSTVATVPTTTVRGSGKTTLLGALVSLLPTDGRVISIEDTLELRLGRANGLRLKARGLAGRGVTSRDQGGTRCGTGPTSVGGVDVGGRFVGQHDGRAGRDRPRDGHALLLTRPRTPRNASSSQ